MTEIHLFAFEGDLYGTRIKCIPLFYIRGEFNTIDNWFYDYGIVNVLFRRIYLLAFWDYVEASETRRNGQKYLKFGHGGLSEKLREFLQNQKDYVYSI